MIARRIKPILLAALATAALATSASAVPMTAGLTLPGTPILPDTGTIIAQILNAPFNTNAIDPTQGVTGLYTEDVLRTSGGTLDFVFDASVDPSNTDGVSRITLTPFDHFLTDVGYDPTNALTGNPGTVIPTFQDRSLNSQVIGFDFGPPVLLQIMPGTTTDDLWIKTNATKYTTGTIGFIDGGGNTYVGFVPVVPEPGSLALLATGGLPLLGFLRRRKLS